MPDSETPEISIPPIEERMAWWHEAKFGMFVHWGCYSVLGRGEQIMIRDMMPLDEYEELGKAFHPAEDWADQIADQAVRAGAKYVVLTTRHHDGYCLFDTRTHEFTAPRTGPGRDLVAEYVEALRKRDLKVGLYFSVHTWRWHGFWDPEKYPEELPKIVDELHTQVRELMTNYGPIDILWYDVPAVPGRSTPGCFGYEGQDIGKTPAEFYRSEELNAMVRQLQPRIIINNRSGLPEDFGTPEQHITPEEGGRAWEACMTLNNAPGWGHIRHSVADKNAGEVLYNLMNAVRLGGNFLFNIGPDGKGYVVERDRHALDRIGKWLERHGEAVYGTRPEGIYKQPGQGPAYHYGMFTCRGNIAYFTIFYYPGDYILLTHVGPAIRKAELLTTGKELEVERISNDRWKISGLPSEPPCDLAPVIKMEFESAPQQKTFRGADWLDGKHA